MFLNLLLTGCGKGTQTLLFHFGKTNIRHRCAVTQAQSSFPSKHLHEDNYFITCTLFVSCLPLLEAVKFMRDRQCILFTLQACTEGPLVYAGMILSTVKVFERMTISPGHLRSFSKARQNSSSASGPLDKFAFTLGDCV